LSGLGASAALIRPTVSRRRGCRRASSGYAGHYRGSLTLVDRDNARLVGIGFYATAGQAREAEAILSTMPDPVRAEAPEEIVPALEMQPESIGLYEIVHRD
jgi:hypothetical protein